MNFKYLKFMFLGFLVLMGCSSVNKRLDTSKAIPAAMGNVKAKVSKDGNTHLDLNVKYLAPANKLRQGASNYVVWVRPGEGSQAIAQNIGVLLIDDELKGELKTITPLKTFNLFITAEVSSQVSEPSGEELLWTDFPIGTL